MEGIPDHHETSLFTRRRQRWSRRLSHPPTRANPSKRRTRGQCAASPKGDEACGRARVATGVSEARSRRRRGKKTPTLVSKAVRQLARVQCRSSIRRSGLGRRETSGPLVMPHEALDFVGCPRSESCVRSRKRARCGCTQFDWVADIDWTHRASSPPGGRKACW